MQLEVEKSTAIGYLSLAVCR